MIKTLVKFVNNQFRRSVKFESCNQKHFSTLIDGNVKIFHARNGCVGEKEIEETMKKDFVLLKEFITIEEESNLMLEIEKSFRRTKYEYDHWDNAIHGFRETEKSHWNECNMEIMGRIQQLAFHKKDAIPATHVLDLAENGYIKPHIDSVKFCGSKIAGLNLLSDSVMRFRPDGDSENHIDVLLPRLSLYIMRDTLRFKYTHELLSNEESIFNDKVVKKDRRISVLHRTEPV